MSIPTNSHTSFKVCIQPCYQSSDTWALRVIPCDQFCKVLSVVTWPDDRSSEQCKNRTGSAGGTMSMDSGCAFYVVDRMFPTKQPPIGCGLSLASIQINSYIHRLDNETRGDSIETFIALLPATQAPILVQTRGHRTP